MNGTTSEKSVFPCGVSAHGCGRAASGNRFPKARPVGAGLNLRSAIAGLGKTLLAAACAFGVPGGFAAEYFVSPYGGHLSPFENWGAAATNAQAALDLANAAKNGSTVWISNSIYAVSGMLVISNATVRGFGGDRSAVVINGGGSVRPFLLNHASAVLRDVTVTNGLAADKVWSGSGGGIYVNAGTVSNCLITGCVSTNQGGGVYMAAGTATVCRVTGNTSGAAGGGFYIKTGVTVAGCEILGNSDSPGTLQSAGGIYLYGGTLTNALIAGNTVWNTGAYAAGGVNVSGWVSSFVADCVVSNNTSLTRTGGIYVGPGAQLHQSTVIGNFGGGSAGCTSTPARWSAAGFSDAASSPTCRATIRIRILRGCLSKTKTPASGIASSATMWRKIR